MNKTQKKGVISLILTSIIGGIIAFATQRAAPTVMEISGSILKTSIQQIGVEYVKKTLNHALSSLTANEEAKNNAANDLADYYADLPSTPKSITLECNKDATPESCIRDNQEEFARAVGLENFNRRMAAMEKAYDSCHDKINTNPRIDLDDSVLVYRTNIRCLALEGFKPELFILAQNDQRLKAILDNLYQ